MWAQFGAALAWAVTPFVLGSASIFHPTWLDALSWAAFLYVATRILVRPEPRLWPLLGVIAGLGMEAKYTIAFLLVAFVVALLAFDRGALRTRGFWIAAGITILFALPNLAWQVRHGWPSLEFASSQNAKTASDTSRPAYVAELILFVGGVIVVAVVGVVWLWRRRLRALAAVPVHRDARVPRRARPPLLPAAGRHGRGRRGRGRDAVVADEAAPLGALGASSCSSSRRCSSSARSSCPCYSARRDDRARLHEGRASTRTRSAGPS